MQQAVDFHDECESLHRILQPLGVADFDRVTQFKGWTINDVVGHLHMFDVAALKTLEGSSSFDAFFAPVLEILVDGGTLRDAQIPWLGDLKGRDLVDKWWTTAAQVADRYARADPRCRVRWAGPEMSARSCITARQMETWAHGQEVFDTLGLMREEHDRIRNVAHMGVAAYGWTFVNRGEPVPEPAPYVRLAGPSGAVWEWGEMQSGNAVSGSAVDFARVVTQVRNIADTDLETTGGAARRWMEIAQCFAGAPENPPAPGARFRV